MIVYAADDEKFALELLKSAIVEAMPDVLPLCFRHSEELLQKAEQTPPDIVFLDILMPGMTGIEVARKLNEISPTVKTVFVTGFGEYTSDAFDVLASGYVMKPVTAEAIAKILPKLNPPASNGLSIKTFGNFDVFYHGKPVKFRSPKSKELLAYLVDREGAFVSRAEAIAVLFEEDDENNASVRLSQYAKRLSEDLEAEGIIGFFVSNNGFYVNLENADCDLSEYLRGNPKYKFAGEYMEQYSFGEFKKGALLQTKR